MISVMVLRTLGMVVLRRLVGVVGLGHGPDAKTSQEVKCQAARFWV
jgi:hypothetical protein